MYELTTYGRTCLYYHNFIPYRIRQDKTITNKWEETRNNYLSALLKATRSNTHSKDMKTIKWQDRFGCQMRGCSGDVYISWRWITNTLHTRASCVLKYFTIHSPDTQMNMRTWADVFINLIPLQYHLVIHFDAFSWFLVNLEVLSSTTILFLFFLPF